MLTQQNVQDLDKLYCSAMRAALNAKRNRFHIIAYWNSQFTTFFATDRATDRHIFVNPYDDTIADMTVAALQDAVSHANLRYKGYCATAEELEAYLDLIA